MTRVTRRTASDTHGVQVYLTVQLRQNFVLGRDVLAHQVVDLLQKTHASETRLKGLKSWRAASWGPTAGVLLANVFRSLMLVLMSRRVLLMCMLML